jgi:hypothetical protein
MCQSRSLLAAAALGLALIQPIVKVNARQSQEIPGPSEPGVSYILNISPNLPPFTFKMTSEVRYRDQFGNVQMAIRDIEVYRGNSTTPTQHLTGCDLAKMTPPPKIDQNDSPWFHTEDVNFDGYQDLFLRNFGINVNQVSRPSGSEARHNTFERGFPARKPF